jgi:predicted phosphoribosyltransferase
MTFTDARDSQALANRLSVSFSGTTMYIVLGLRVGGLGVGLNMAVLQRKKWSH